jgi:hypothetical protein
VKKVTAKGCCAECGNADLLLCVDRTEYTPLKMIKGAWVQDPREAHTEIINGDETIRLMCPNCGEYHQVPELFNQGE